MPVVNFSLRLDLKQVSEDSAEILVSGQTLNIKLFKVDTENIFGIRLFFRLASIDLFVAE